jgi:hypothetical protein
VALANMKLNEVAKLLTEAVRAEQLKTVDKIPPGYFTTEQLAKELKLSRRRTAERLQLLVHGKKWDMKRFRIPVGESVLLVPHYRPK